MPGRCLKAREALLSCVISRIWHGGMWYYQAPKRYPLGPLVTFGTLILGLQLRNTVVQPAASDLGVSSGVACAASST